MSIKSRIIGISISFVLAWVLWFLLPSSYRGETKPAPAAASVELQEVKPVVIVMPDTQFDDQADMANPRGEDELAFGRLVEEVNTRALEKVAYPPTE